MRASTLDAISMETTQDRTIACPAFLHKKIGGRPAWQAEIHSRKDVVPTKVDNRYAQTLLEEDQRQIETKKRVGETFRYQQGGRNGTAMVMQEKYTEDRPMGGHCHGFATFISQSRLRGLRDLRWGRRVETEAAGEATKEGSESRDTAGASRRGRFVMKD